MINFEVFLILPWSENCVLRSKATRDVAPRVVAINNLTGARFKIKDTKLYVPVVIISAENDNKLLRATKTGFKTTIKWNKYRSEMSNQTVNNNLNYLTDPTYTNVSRLFVLSFKKEDGNDDENKSVRTSFKKYYVSKAEVNDFNVLTAGEAFFEIPVKSKEETYEAVYWIMNIFSKRCKLIATDLSKQIELENPDLKQQINFIGRLEENNATMFFIIEEK